MTEEIKANLIVEAIAKGFDKVSKDLKMVGTSATSLEKALSKSSQSMSKMGVASKKLENQTRSLSTMQAKMAQVGRQTEAALSRQEQKTRALAEAQEKLEAQQQKLRTSQMMLGAAMIGAAAVSTKFLAGTTQLAARVETLGVVTATLGKNVGMTETEIRGLEKAIQAQGITVQASRQAIALMIQAEIDLAHATDLARLAQDAAVIAGTDSSEAYEKLTYVISSGSVVMARRMGLMVDFQGAYTREAEALGRSSAALTAQEKVTIRTNEVMRQGANISGAYSAAMETAGKKITSVTRHWEESRRILGETFLPIYASLIDMLINSLKAWENLNGATQRQVSAGAAVVTGWTGILGAGLLLVGMLPKISAGLHMIGLAGHAALGPIGILTGLIVALTAAMAAEVAKNQYVAETLREITREALDTGKSYKEYREETAKLAEAEGRSIKTREELAIAQAEANERLKEASQTGAVAALSNEWLAKSYIVMSEEIYNTAQAWSVLKQAGLENATAQEIAALGVDKHADRLYLLGNRALFVAESEAILAVQTAEAAEQEAELAEETKKAGEALDALATIVSGVATEAWEAYGAGSEDAITDMLYNLVATGDAMQNMGDVGEMALEGYAKQLGIFDQRTSDVTGAIKIFQAELDNAGDTLEEKEAAAALFNKRMLNLGTYLMDAASAAGEATTNVVALIEASGRDIASPMAAFRKDIEWFVAGGGQIAEAYQKVLTALTEGKITPMQAHEMIGSLVAVAKDLEVEIGHESLENAAGALAEALGIGIDEAAEMITGTVGSALESLGDIDAEISVFEEINAGVEGSEINIDRLIARPNVVQMDTQNILSADQDVNNLYQNLARVTKPTWSISMGMPDFNVPGGGGGGKKKKPYEYVKHQQGLSDFVVPPGFSEPGNPYLISAGSGEQVNIKSARETSLSGGEDININMHNQIASYFDIEEMADSIVSAIKSRMY